MVRMNSNRKPFSLIELMVAFFILAFALSSIVVIIHRYSNSYFNATCIEKAVLLARSKMEEVRLNSAEMFPSGSSEKFKDNPGYSWTVQRNRKDASDKFLFEFITVSVFYPQADGDKGNISLQLLLLQEKDDDNVSL